MWSRHPVLLTILFLLLAAASARAQSLAIAGIDTSAFPLVTGRFYALDQAGQRIGGLTPADFSVTENGSPRTILSVSCPSDQTAEQISAVLTVDVSGSMADPLSGVPKIDIARAGLRSIIQAMPLGSSECALTSFDDANYLDQDFTTDPNKLLAAVARLKPQGTTDYDAAFIRTMAGALYIAGTRGLKRVVIFLTDGQGYGHEDEIVKMALDNDITVYGITLGWEAPTILKNITARTGGRSFDYVTTPEQAVAVYRTVLQMALGIGSCQVTWESAPDCAAERQVELALRSPALRATARYTVPPRHMPKLLVSPAGLRFGRVPPGTTVDLPVTLTAGDADVTITSFGAIIDGPFQLVSPPATPLTIPAGTSIPLTIRFQPTDSAITFGRFPIASSACPSPTIYASGGYHGAPAGTLRLLRPNGGETFGVGADTTITWEGILPTDTVRIDYSTDGGSTWSTIADTASGLSHAWHVPATPSDRCLARIEQVSRGEGAWQWSVRGGGSQSEGSGGIALLAGGGIAVAGWFEKSAEFGGTTLYSSDPDHADAYLVTYRSDGTVAWARRMGGTGYDYGYGVAADRAGSIYVTGSFNGVADFGDGTTLVSAGSSDIFVAKFRPDGSVEWARRAGGADADRGAAITVGRNGKIFVTGWFDLDADFGSTQLQSRGSSDAFIACYRNDGSIEWARSMGGIGYDYGAAVSTTPDGDIIAAGSFLGGIDLDAATHLTAAGGVDGYIARFAPEGTLRWGKRLGGPSDDAVTAVAADSTGAIYVAGVFSDSASIAGGATIRSSGRNDWLIARLAGDGTPLWSRGAGGADADTPYGLAVDGDGNLFVAGAVTGTVALDGLTTSAGTAGQGLDILLAKYHPTGAPEWSVRAGGPKDDHGIAIAAAPGRNLYVTGTFTGWSSFGSTGTLASAGLEDMFVAWLRDESVAPPPDTSDALWRIVSPRMASMDVDMGSAIVGTLRDSVIEGMIGNTGTVPLRIDSIAIVGGNPEDFLLLSNWLPRTLAPGEERELELDFHPGAPGRRDAGLRIYAQTGAVTRSVTGLGLAPEIAIAATTIDFGRVELGGSADTTVPALIANIGQRTISVSATRMLGPNTTDFVETAGGGAFTLLPGEEREVRLRFSPSAVGRTAGRIALDYDGIGSPAIVQLFGEGYSGGASATLGVGELWAAPGEIVEIPIAVADSRELAFSSATAITGSLRYNRTLLFPIESIPAGAIVRNRVDGDDRVLDLLFPLSSPLAANGRGVLGKIRFEAVLGNDTTTALRLEGTGSVGGPLQIATTAGRFHLTGICLQGGARLFDDSGAPLKITSIHPDPARDRVTVEFDAIEQGPTSLLLIDALGREVRSAMRNQEILPGHHEAPIDLEGLATGSYTLLLRTPTKTLTSGLRIMR